MNVKTFLIQPPIYTISFSAVKDTYTRQSRPNLNYGNLQTMVVGRGADGEYIGYVEIDISQLTQYYGMNWYSLKLVFNRVEVAGNRGKIDVYECYSTWYEYYLTYINQLTLSPQPLFSVEIDADTVKIDVKDLVKILLKQGKTKLNLALKSNDCLLLKTRESGQGISLEFRFSDPNWNGYADEKFLPSKAQIRTISKKDWYAISKIRFHNHFKGQAIIKNPAIFESNVYITKAFIPSEISIVHSNYLNGNALIRQKGNYELVSNFTKINSEQISKGRIKNRIDLLSSAEILPEYDIYDFGGGAERIRTFLLSSVLSVRSIYLNGNVLIRKSEINDLQSEANINQGIFSKATVNEQSFRGSVILRNKNLSDIEATASITPDLKGKVKFVLGSYLVSSIFVRYQGYNDLNTKSEIPSPSDIISQGRVRQTTNNDLLSQGKVRRKNNLDLQSETNILERTELYSQGRVRRYDQKDLLSQFKVRQKGNLDLQSETEIRGKIELYSQVKIIRYDQKDLLSQFKVRRQGFKDIEGQTEIYNVSDIEGQFEIYLAKNLHSQARIRQFDVEDRFSQAYIDHGYYVIHIPSTAEIRIKFKHLISYATIHSDARLWRPNVEGGLKFNRKLPRIWKREEFIKDL